jgi:hypothetical protein
MRGFKIVKKFDATNMPVKVGTPRRFNAYTGHHHEMKTLHIHLIS